MCRQPARGRRRSQPDPGCSARPSRRFTPAWRDDRPESRTFYVGTPHRALRESGVSRMPRPTKIPGAKRHACFAVLTIFAGPAPVSWTRVMRLVSGPDCRHRGTHPYLRRQTSSSRRCVVGHALVLRPSSQVSPSVAVTVTTTPSGSGGIELERMEHAVDPSRCATNVPQDHCSGSVPPDHDGGPKPLTCANTAWRRRARTDDLRIQNDQAVYTCTTWHKMCHLALLRDGSGGHEAGPKPLTSTNASGPRRARTDDLRIKSPQLYQLS